MSDYARLAAEAKSRFVSNQVDAEIQKTKVDEESEFFERVRTSIHSEIEEANQELARFELPPIAFAEGWGDGHTLQLGLESLEFLTMSMTSQSRSSSSRGVLESLYSTLHLVRPALP
jgi:hypothetical protein